MTKAALAFSSYLLRLLPASSRARLPSRNK